MPILEIAQAASEGFEVQRWFLDLAPLVIVGVLSLVGVVLGSRLDRKARMTERQAAESAELRKDASEVIGTARVVLTALGPDVYALWASPTLNDEIEKRRREADAIRPGLAALAVRWPEAAPELNAVERHLGTMPNRLAFLVQSVLNHDPFTNSLDEIRTDHEAMVDALDRAIQRLAEQTKSTNGD